MDTLSLAISEADRIDDLPRAFTYRRQRAREEADAKIAPEARLAPLTDASVGQLAAFFVKCVVAAIPALLLLGAVLWLAGEGLELAFPELVRMKIVIYAPEAGG
jgi:hypothetical protein